MSRQHPELRDLLLERGFALTVLDPNDDVYGFMTELMEHPRHPNEMYEKLDWRDADFVPGTFDVVLSDLLLFHLPDRVLIGELYERLHTWMASGGVVLTREIISLPANRFPSCADLVVAWRRGEIQNPSDLSHLLIFCKRFAHHGRASREGGWAFGVHSSACFKTKKNIISAEEYEMLSTVALPWQGIAHRREDLRLSMEAVFPLGIPPSLPAIYFLSNHALVAVNQLMKDIISLNEKTINDYLFASCVHT